MHRSILGFSDSTLKRVERCPACAGTTFSDVIQTGAQMQKSDLSFQFQQCKECQLVLLNPRLPVDALKDYYTDHYLPYRGAAAWGKFSAFVRRSQRQLDIKRARLVHDFHPLDENALVLDIGCGKPTFLKTIANRYRCETLGLDFSDAGWKSHPEDFSDIQLFTGEVKDLLETDRTRQKSPAVITMWHYLEHDYDPLANLQRLRQLAAPDTSLFIEIPDYDSESRRRYGRHWAGYHTPRHTFLFSPENIRRLLHRSGWQVSEIRRTATLDPYLLEWMSRMEKEGINWQDSMEARFPDFLWGKIRFGWNAWRRKKSTTGMMLVLAKAHTA